MTPQVIRGLINPTLLAERGDIAPTLLHHAEAVNASLVVVSARERRGAAGWFGLGVYRVSSCDGRHVLSSSSVSRPAEVGVGRSWSIPMERLGNAEKDPC